MLLTCVSQQQVIATLLAVAVTCFLRNEGHLVSCQKDMGLCTILLPEPVVAKVLCTVCKGMIDSQDCDWNQDLHQHHLLHMCTTVPSPWQGMLMCYVWAFLSGA